MSSEKDILQRVMEAKNDIGAADRLIADYLPYIKSETAKSVGRVVREGVDDELSIAMMAFHEAIDGYSRSKGSFLKFASLVIKRRIIDYGRREKKFSGHVSMSAALSEDESLSVEDTVGGGESPHEDMHAREDFAGEINELALQLEKFGITLTDVANNCPRQERTLNACRSALAFTLKNTAISEKLIETKKLPLAELSAGSGVERKTLERHRKYMIALLLIYSNGYDSIRNHLKQMFELREGGDNA